jgi:hypothetical protein
MRGYTRFVLLATCKAGDVFIMPGAEAVYTLTDIPTAAPPPALGRRFRPTIKKE